MSPKHWLMKAEPDSRIVKGKDVKFSVDDFESVKTTPWEGVRNAEARNLMKEMKVGDKVLFYHSNCKNPGIASFAEVSREAYPDCDSHPYYDAKTDKENPKWYMVDVTFVSRAAHFVPLSLLRNIASSSDLADEVSYIGKEGAQAIKEMALVTRGRLSVQRVEPRTWDVVQQLAARGGWEEADSKTSKSKAKPKGKGKSSSRQKSRSKKKADEDASDQGEDSQPEEERDDVAESTKSKKPGRRKRKVEDVESEAEQLQPRRSTRVRR
ncbi:DUF55-domain-containing protein [Fomes fomentarius]|nr:DUF55-domain-containing protein [Fomes fomentarius]